MSNIRAVNMKPPTHYAIQVDVNAYLENKHYRQDLSFIIPRFSEVSINIDLFPYLHVQSPGQEPVRLEDGAYVVALVDSLSRLPSRDRSFGDDVRVFSDEMSFWSFFSKEIGVNDE